MLFIIDENVALDARGPFVERGHTVAIARLRTGAGAPDAAVLADAEKHAAVLLTHDQDFYALMPRKPPENRLTHRRAGRIIIQLDERVRQLPARLAYFLPLIESEHAWLQSQTDQRLMVTLFHDRLWVER